MAARLKVSAVSSLPTDQWSGGLRHPIIVFLQSFPCADDIRQAYAEFFRLRPPLPPRSCAAPFHQHIEGLAGEPIGSSTTSPGARAHIATDFVARTTSIASLDRPVDGR